MRRPIHAEFRVVVGVSSEPNSRWWLVDPACWSSSLLGGSSIPRRISRRVPPRLPAPASLSRQNEDAIKEYW
ncbi:Os06g0253450 [Oryza sativa Japonica Group]|nr:Os06g0253450 [Oryza sativa Japonica Group]